MLYARKFSLPSILHLLPNINNGVIYYISNTVRLNYITYNIVYFNFKIKNQCSNLNDYSDNFISLIIIKKHKKLFISNKTKSKMNDMYVCQNVCTLLPPSR